MSVMKEEYKRNGKRKRAHCAVDSGPGPAAKGEVAQPCLKILRDTLSPEAVASGRVALRRLVPGWPVEVGSTTVLAMATGPGVPAVDMRICAGDRHEFVDHVNA